MTPEQEYRRGYCDGYVIALNTLQEFVINNGLDIFITGEALFEFWQGALANWKLQQPLDKMILAPEPTPLFPEENAEEVIGGVITNGIIKRLAEIGYEKVFDGEVSINIENRSIVQKAELK